MTDAVVSTIKITQPLVLATKDELEIDDMDAVAIQPSKARKVICAQYFVAKVLTRPLKKVPVSYSSSLDGQADTNKKTETLIGKDEYVLEAIVAASTSFFVERKW